SISITDLFYNTPARKKFLKGPAAEASRIHELLAAMSLAAPDLHLRLTHQDRDLLDLAPGAVAQRLRRIWDIDREQSFMQVEMERDGLSIEGWLSTPDLLWPNRRRLLLFVNRRLIAMPALSHAIADGIGAGRGRFPVGVLQLSMAASEVDVNVHPMKSEVRLRDAETVLRRVREAVSQALRRAPAVPLFTTPPPPAASWRTAPATGDPFAGWPDAAPLVLHHEGRISLVRDNRLWVVDPHVWHERRLRERLQSHPPSVPLDFPLMLELADCPFEVLQGFGIQAERFGPATWLIRSLPEGFERLADAGRLEAVLRQPDFLEAAPCAAAIPAGQTVSAPLLQRLLADLVPADLELGCHGRPAALRLEASRLDRLHTGEQTSRQEALQS
ncbi:MAG: DNA mismatch repair MutL family protein, partial [Candidatus Xenobia bacterium]